MRKIVSGLILMLVSAVALAGQCPTDMAAIDEHLAGNPEVASEDMSRVEELREQGEQLHEEGNHEESVAALAEAKEILGIE